MLYTNRGLCCLSQMEQHKIPRQFALYLNSVCTEKSIIILANFKIQGEHANHYTTDGVWGIKWVDPYCIKDPPKKLDLTFRLAGMLSLVVCINVWSKSTNRTNFFVFNNLFSSSLPISLACWKCILYINIAKVNLHKNCQFKKINGLTGKNIWYFDILNWLKYNYKTNELVLYSLNENEFFIVVFHWSQMSQYSLLSLEYCDTCLFVSFLPLSCIVCIIDISYCMATVMYIICCKL